MAYMLFGIIGWVLTFGLWYELPEFELYLGVWTGDDLEHAATLLLVTTVMLFCQFLFEVMYWRETQYCMPSKEDRPWSLKEDGYPNDWHLCWLFGPPCIWFSSQQAYDDLRIWVTLASGEHSHSKSARVQSVVRRVFFEELALYAMQNETSATRLRRSLLQAKLFDKETDSFLRRERSKPYSPRHEPPHVLMRDISGKLIDTRGPKGFYRVDLKAGQRPDELGLELLFYDDRSGVYWAPDSLDVDVFKDKVVSHQLRNSTSVSPTEFHRRSNSIRSLNITNTASV